ncbi:hypothetical protein CSAL01_08000 [Colletotrichum salicis]|uniref:Zn(2)-C6 fungal-type domain-containing protein n=1 Tax=Colletotrichum salicis TaxID=1209931 RepID=A0A135UT04_9PEZI|nr:hypothetical protein CSAL01_08000 [Colletotrichum salicis]
MEKTMVSPPAASPSTISPASSSHLGKRRDHSEDAQESSSGGGGIGPGGYNGGGGGVGGGGTSTGRKSSSSGGSRPKRAQVSRACARCKNLRRACNEYRPCKRCVDAGLGDQCLGLPGPVSLAWVSDGSQAFGHVPHEAVQRMADLLPARVMDYCVDRFFARLHPTIPILTPEYVAQLKVVAGPSEAGMEAHCLLTAPGVLVPAGGDDVVFAVEDEYARGVGESEGRGSVGHVVYRAVEYGKGGDAAVERGVDVYRDGGEWRAAVDFGSEGYAKGESAGDAAVVEDYPLAAAFAVRVSCRGVCSLAEYDVSLPSRGGQGLGAVDAGFTGG